LAWPRRLPSARCSRIVRRVEKPREAGIAVVIDVPTMTAQQYDVVAGRLGWSGVDVTPPDGLIVHVAGPTPGGWRIVDVWRDEKAFRHFATSAVGPALEGLRLPAYEPQVIRAHHSVFGSADILR
jgi:hypothetical protein